jgi:hypothetical protein
MSVFTKIKLDNLAVFFLTCFYILVVQGAFCQEIVNRAEVEYSWPYSQEGPYSKDDSAKVQVSYDVILLIYPGTWNLISIPRLFPENASNIDAVFASIPKKTKFFIYHWDTEKKSDTIFLKYDRPKRLVPGKGYWFWLEKRQKDHDASKPEEILIKNGRPTKNESGSFEILLSKGWNQIGNPYPYAVYLGNSIFVIGKERLSFSQACKAEWIERYLWAYENEYYPVDDKVVPFRGLWIKSKRDCSMLIKDLPYGEDKSMKALGRNYIPAFFVDLKKKDVNIQILLYGRKKNDLYNFCGTISSGADDGYDGYDISEPPPAIGSPFALYFRCGNERLSFDYRAPIPKGTFKTWKIEVLSDDEDSLTIEWNIYNFPKGFNAILVDEKIRKTVRLLKSGRYTFYPQSRTSKRIFSLRVGEGPLIERRFKIEKILVYPNPSFDQINFVAEIGTDEVDVSLLIYNIAGELVRSLSQTERPKPNEEKGVFLSVFKWDGRNKEGVKVGSGIYLYLMEVTNQQGKSLYKKGKFILLK